MCVEKNVMSFKRPICIRISTGNVPVTFFLSRVANPIWNSCHAPTEGQCTCESSGTCCRASVFPSQALTTRNERKHSSVPQRNLRKWPPCNFVLKIMYYRYKKHWDISRKALLKTAASHFWCFCLNWNVGAFCINVMGSKKATSPSGLKY